MGVAAIALAAVIGFVVVFGVVFSLFARAAQRKETEARGEFPSAQRIAARALFLAVFASSCGEDTGTEFGATNASPGPTSTLPESSAPVGATVPPGPGSSAPSNGVAGSNGGAPGPGEPTPTGVVPTVSGSGGETSVPAPGPMGGALGSGEPGAGGGVLGTGGQGGSSLGGADGNPSMAGGGGVAAGSGGQGNEAGAGGSGGSGGPVTGDLCPADATFCSGFETAELPEGAVFKLNGDPATPWTALFEVDAAVSFSGDSSLRVRKNSEPNASTMYKMLAVPSGGADFWVRLYLRSDIVLGQEGHNAYAIASATDDPNDAAKVEFADDVGLSFNASDDVRWPEGYGRLTSGGTNPYSLPENEWHCIELHFDGSGRTQSLYVAGAELLVASNYPSSAISFGTFKFGYVGYHNEADRTVWYDDVAVGPTRMGCAGP